MTTSKPKTITKVLNISVSKLFNGGIGFNMSSPTGDWQQEWTQDEWEEIILRLKEWKKVLLK